MTRIVPLTPELMHEQTFIRSPDYSFASNTSLCELSQREIAVACTRLPVAFVKSEGDTQFKLAAMMGFDMNSNLLVDQDGRWRSDFVPESIRLYPFSIHPSGDDKLVLCIDLDSGLIQPHSKGLDLFENGEPSTLLQQIFEMLIQTHTTTINLLETIEQLNKLGLIVPWELKFTTPAGENRNVGGLFKIDEKRLNEVPATELANLRDHGGLALAYCQMLSMHNLSYLKSLLNNHDRAIKSPSVLDANLLNDEESGLNFDNL